MLFHQLITDNIEKAQGSCIALIGGGGKTALLHKLANEFAEYYPAVLQTSLTKTAFYPLENPLFFSETDVSTLNSIRKERNPLFVVGDKISNEKLKGILVSDLNKIKQQFDLTIFECDGARTKPLKAHTDCDPLVPKFATHCVIIVGADVINTKVRDGLVHRPELFCKTWNVTMDFVVSIDLIVQVVASQKGYLSKVYNETEIIYFINKWDSHQKFATDLAQAIYHNTSKPTFYGSVQNNVLKKVQV